MIDTRETIYADARYGPFGKCRFMKGDVLRHATYYFSPTISLEIPIWDKGKGGWCIQVWDTHVHESNFILWDDFISWIPCRGEYPFQSWWILKNSYVGKIKRDGI